MMDIKEESILPLSNRANGSAAAPPIFETSTRPYINGYALNSGSDPDKKSDESGRSGRARGNSNAAWLPQGTRQEDTWTQREFNGNGTRVAVS